MMMVWLARWSLRRRRWVVVAWVFAVFAVTGAVGGAGASFSAGFSLPGTDSQKAADLLATGFGSVAADADRVVWHVGSGRADAPAVTERVGRALRAVAAVPSVAAVDQGAVSADGRTAFATVQYRVSLTSVPHDDIQAVSDAVGAASGEGVVVAAGGPVVGQLAGPQVDARELIGVLFAALVLYLAFRSVLVMLVPVGTALVAMMVGQSTIALLTHVVDLPNTAPTVALLLGLGVGIDYALFVVNRHRGQVRAGMDVEESVVTAMGTTGRGVVFAGVTVVVALLGLLALRIPVLTGMGLAAALSVSIAVAGSLTLLPAVLGVLGLRVVPKKERAALAAGAAVADSEPPVRGSVALVARRPVVTGVVGLVVLLALAGPVASMRLGVADQGADPEGTQTRQAYDLLAAGFGPGVNGPLVVAVATPTPADAQKAQALVGALAAQTGVAQAGPLRAAPSGAVALVQVVPTTSPQDRATSDLIERIRTDVLPASGLTAHVGGTTATFDDFTDVIAGRFWGFVVIVVVVSVLVLVMAFRSIWLPVAGALLNLVSAGAAFGVVVAVFQDGRGAGLLGIQTGPIEPFIPVLAFAILFGLSMDYQVFLVTRVREEWLHTRDARQATLVGQTRTGRVITLAATIMIFVFASFVLSDARSVKLVGFAMAVAVALDAFVIRQVVVPALLHLLGEQAWWMPAWLDRALPRLSVDGPARDDAARPVATAAGGSAAGAAGWTISG